MSYRVAHFNAADEDLWKWFPIGGDAEVELKLVTRPDLTAAVGRGADNDAFAAHVARTWFRDFRGLIDAKGAPIANSDAARIEILKDQDVWKRVQEILTSSAAWREEGNAGSGSA